ncbi:hypothetical protein KCP69_25945 [Salmonella enterica subsp. enterica]|nr:hypothetical protein KCP69_25945 [Salmonella enterica subsp. enterica]
MAAAARELNLYESQLYNWRSKQQNQHSSSEREQEMSLVAVQLVNWLNGMRAGIGISPKAATPSQRLK